MTQIRGQQLQRFRYWQGQRLRSFDFRRQRDNSGHLRWWHNRALHSAFGIRFGLDVVSETNANGDVLLWLNCGLAYDCFGRELILPQRRQIILPTGQSDEGKRILLFLSCPDSGEEKCGSSSQTRSCAAFAEGKALDLRWVAEQQSQPGDGVPLALFEFSDGAWRERESEFFAPHTPAVSRPLLVSGRSLPGELVWEPWTIRRQIVGVQTRVDTSAAGFTQTPRYFAAFNTSSQVDVPSSGQGFFTHLADTAPDGFLFRVFMGSNGIALAFRLYFFTLQVRQNGLTLCWLACSDEQLGLSRCPGVIRRSEPCPCNKEDS